MMGEGTHTIHNFGWGYVSKFGATNTETEVQNNNKMDFSKISPGAMTNPMASICFSPQILIPHD
jgi:hypothetical protein